MRLLGAADRRTRAALGYVALAVLAYGPVLRSASGKVAADTKQYLYLDPARLLERSPTMWDPNIGMGTVTHQTIGYLFPMGPYYWTLDRLGVPDWVAQRLWLGSLLFAAGLGVVYMLRTFGIRGPGVAVGAIAYMLTPYSLDYAARISVLLMPWAALPWMIGFVRKALADGGWRYPALFALVVQIVGGVNATALLFAGLGPALWVLYSWLAAREVSAARALRVAAKIGVATVVTSAWWIVGLSIQGGYGLNVLRYTETVEAVARTSTPNEVLRGLGYWFFYGQDRLGPWIEAAENYTQRTWVILAGYGLAALALLSAGLVRWRHRAFFGGLLIVGVVIAVGANPYGSPTPLGAAIKAFATSSTVGLAMRSTARAVPLVVLATAVFLAVGVNAVHDALQRAARPRLAFASVAAVVGLVFANFPALADGTFYGENLQRPEKVPAYWHGAASYLDERGDETRVLELPGADFASYDWGNTVDPITPGLMDRPYVARELIPWGSPATADLLNAMDRRIQDGLFDPNGFAALARRMGVGDVVLRNDIQHERYDLRSALALARDFSDVPGLGGAVAFGGQAAAPTTFDELAIAAPTGEGQPAPVVIYPVVDPTAIVRAEAVTNAVMVAGDGEGMVDTADVGILDGAGVAQYAASYATADELRAAIADDTVLVLTDSNRRRARRWTSVRQNLGVTEQPGEVALRDDPGDARLAVFPDGRDDAQSTVDQRGVRWATATSYGNTITYTPEDAAPRAFDGDPSTAWRAGAYGAGIGERIHLELDRPITTDRVTLVQPQNRGRERRITEVAVRFDDGARVHAELDGTSLTAAGQVVTFPRQRFRSLDIEVTDVNFGARRLHGGSNAVGFAEIRVRDEQSNDDIRVDEVVRMPRDLLDSLGDAPIANALVVVMTRDRIVPVPPRADPEAALVREFSLPVGREFSLTGTARLTSLGDHESIARVLGRTDEMPTDASEFLPGCVGCRADAAFDGDLTTAWQTPLERVRGQWVEIETAAPRTVDQMQLAVVADGRHSVPTRVRLEVDGGTRDLAVPAIADQPTENAATTVALEFPALTGRRFRLTVTAVREVASFNYYANAPELLPVAIAEVGLPDVVLSALPPVLAGECRPDLLEVDDRSFPVAVIGPTDRAVDSGPLTLEPCDPADPARTPTLMLEAGSHLVRTAPGVDTALALDRLVLASEADGDALAVGDGRVTGLPRTPPPTPTVRVVDDGRTHVRVEVDGAREPFWLVLGQSDSTGWQASATGAELGPRRLVDGYANGWLVDPTTESFSVVFDWAPQRRVWASLWVSAIAAVACLGIVIATWRRRRIDAPAALPIEIGLPAGLELASPLVRALAPIALGVMTGLIAAPWIGIVVAVALWAATRSRGVRFVLAVAPAGLVAIAGVAIAAAQSRYTIPPVFEWPTLFPRARTLAWLAVALLAGLFACDIVRPATRRAARDSG
ncbi:MAG: alpha-(1-_3)-arabinofuranosyltransferase domain-containing protein [Actinomycetota bacterium]